jgi:hypothetical protein
MSQDFSEQDHLPGEATPQDVGVPAETPEPPSFGLHDSTWSDNQWLDLLETLINAGIVSWKEVTALVLGHLNPSQVGTSLASSQGFKRRYGKGNTMRIVMDWVYHQTGQCADCGTRLELQADHIEGRENFTDPLDADYIENMTLRCRRCNVVRRPSHEFGGLTFLTAEAALMWILFVIRPRTFRDFVRLCRIYGMTMSDIRMNEAWSMAHWLSRDNPPAYGIEDDLNQSYDIVLWSDSAITRVDPGFSLPPEARRIYSRVSGSSVLGFLTLQGNGRILFHEQPVEFIPFSTYQMGNRVPQSLAIHYRKSDRQQGDELSGLAPRGMELIAYSIREEGQHFRLLSSAGDGDVIDLPSATPHGRIVKTRISPANCQLSAV